MTKEFLTELTYKIIGAAIEVHKTLGPGLPEAFTTNALRMSLTYRV